MVKNVMGLSLTVKFIGTPNKWYHIQVPKKTIVRRLRQIMEDVNGSPTGAYNVYTLRNNTSMALTNTINSYVTGSETDNDVDLEIRVEDE